MTGINEENVLSYATMIQHLCTDFGVVDSY